MDVGTDVRTGALFTRPTRHGLSKVEDGENL